MKTYYSCVPKEVSDYFEAKLAEDGHSIITFEGELAYYYACASFLVTVAEIAKPKKDAAF